MRQGEQSNSSPCFHHYQPHYTYPLPVLGYIIFSYCPLLCFTLNAPHENFIPQKEKFKGYKNSRMLYVKKNPTVVASGILSSLSLAKRITLPIVNSTFGINVLCVTFYLFFPCKYKNVPLRKPHAVFSITSKFPFWNNMTHLPKKYMYISVTVWWNGNLCK